MHMLYPKPCAGVLSRFSHIRLSVTLWTVACQSPLSMGFSRWEWWSRWSCPPPGDLLDPGIKSKSLMSLTLVGMFLFCFVLFCFYH